MRPYLTWTIGFVVALLARPLVSAPTTHSERRAELEKTLKAGNYRG